MFGRLIDDPSPSSTTLNSLESAPVDSAASNRPTPPIRIIDVTIFVDPFEDFLNQKKASEETTDTTTNTHKNVKGSQSNNTIGSEVRNGDGVNDDDNQVTWTGKRVRSHTSGGRDPPGSSGVGKYLKEAMAVNNNNENTSNSSKGPTEQDEIVEFVDEYEEPAEPEHARKKMKSSGGGGFGNFDNW